MTDAQAPAVHDWPGTFRLHLGFHKTASTHIQRILDHNHHHLKRSGTFVVPHKRLRNKYTRITETFANQQIGMEYGEPMTKDEYRALAHDFWQKVPFDRFDHIVLSEENVAGHVGQCVFPGLLYRFPKTYMRYFKAALPVRPTVIDVVIRRYDSFFASCYLEYISSTGAHRYVSVDEMMAKVMVNAPSWVDVLQMMGQVFGRATINVWIYEELRQTMPVLLEELTGRPADALLPLDDTTRSRASPSATVLAEFEKVLRSQGVAAALAAWKDLKEDFGRTKGPAFEPWSDQDKAHLTRLYEADIAEISADPRFTLRRPA